MKTIPLVRLAERATVLCKARDGKLVTVESCTAGALSTLLADIPGAGDVLEGGFVSYAKSYKVETLGVDGETVEHESAVCAPVAIAMAQGALKLSPSSSIAIAITGVCGPLPDEDGNPVGLSYIAVAHRAGVVKEKKFEFDRNLSSGQLRGEMLGAALTLLIETLSYD